MKNIKLGLLLAAALASGFAHAAEQIDTVIYNEGKIQNVPFTLDQPIVIVDAKKPTAITFQRNDKQLLTFKVCDYISPVEHSRCHYYQSDVVPYYVFSDRGFILQPKPKPAVNPGSRTDISI